MYDYLNELGIEDLQMEYVETAKCRDIFSREEMYREVSYCDDKIKHIHRLIVKAHIKGIFARIKERDRYAGL